MRRVADGIPMEIRVEADSLGGKPAALVGLYRTDRENPHSLCMQFFVTKESIQEGRMSFVVYDALLGEMSEVLQQVGGEVCNRLLGRTKRVKSRTVSE